MNRTLFFGFNTRTNSYFQGTDLASSGLPQGKELEILEQYRDKLPPELFTQEFKLPVYDTPQAERKYLQAGRRPVRPGRLGDQGRQDGQRQDRRAVQVRDPRLTNDTDQVISSPYIANLRKIGVDATLRIVDQTQYVNRVNNFDFDVIIGAAWRSRNRPATSSAISGVRRPPTRRDRAIIPASRTRSSTRLVDRIIFATDRDDLVAATHALDRVLLWNYYVVPQYHRPVVWLAYWNKFGIPEKQPSYSGADINSWWIDPEKEKALAAKYKGSN